MLLSVIISTRNRAYLLDRALNSLVLQRYPAKYFEIIVIDNGSTDRTPEVCQTFKQKLPNLQYCFEPLPGLHMGRHLGLKKAKAEILVYADDDIEATPTWLEGVAEAFEDGNVCLVGGPILPKFETQPPDWILRMWEQRDIDGRRIGYLSLIDLGDELRTINPHYVFGCNFSIKRSVLIEAGGFHPDGMPRELIHFRGDGESHICRFILEKGYKVFYHPKVAVYHIVTVDRMTEQYFSMRAFNQGISDSYTKIREKLLHGNAMRNQKKQIIDLIKTVQFLSFHRIRAIILRQMQSILRKKKKDCHPNITKVLAHAYRQGWEFHQNAVRRDPELLAHVLRETYIDWANPVLGDLDRLCPKMD